MVHPLDALLRDSVNPVAKERGYVRKGRNYFRYNDNGDAAHIAVDLVRGSTQFSMEAGISCRLGRKVAPPEPGFRWPAGQWSWTVPGRGLAYDDGTDLWDIDIPGIRDDLRSSWVDLLDITDALLEPGALTAELRSPTDRYPGHFARSELHLAYSILNDGGLPAATTDLLVRRIALADPIWGRQLQLCLDGDRG